MDVLLDCVKYNFCYKMFVIVHLKTNELSIISSLKTDDFVYLGLDDWRVLTMAGESVVVTDDEGEKHRIIRIV